MNENKEVKVIEKTASVSKSGSPSVSPFRFKRQPIIGGQKMGRNISCFCGSGNKYKHCCLKKEQDNIRNQQAIITQQLIAKEFIDGHDQKESIEKQKEENKIISSSTTGSKSTERIG